MAKPTLSDRTSDMLEIAHNSLRTIHDVDLLKRTPDEKLKLIHDHTSLTLARMKDLAQ